MLKGWLVVNSFVVSDKFDELYSLLCTAAKGKNVLLERKTGAELMQPLCLGLPLELPDFVLFWDKDIRLAQLLEARGLRLFNSADSVFACDDKSLTYITLKNKNIHQPKTVIAPKTYPLCGYWDTGFLKSAAAELGLPLIIKECFGSFGKQVYLAHTLEEAEIIVGSLGCAPFIMQEFIKTSFGRDLRISVVGGKAVAAMLRTGGDGDFRSNLTIGGHPSKYEANEAQRSLAVAACEALCLDFGGVDVLFGENDEPIICEVNSNAHFKTTLDCTGVNMAELIIGHICEVTEGR